MESYVLALARLVAGSYYIGCGTAAAHYECTRQPRKVSVLVTPQHLRDQKLLNADVRIVNVTRGNFFCFGPSTCSAISGACLRS